MRKKKRKKSYIIPGMVISAAAVAVAARVFQLPVVVDYNEMGFFNATAGFFAAYGLYLMLLFAVILLITGAINDKSTGAPAFTRPAASLTPKQTVALGIAFLLGAGVRFYELVFRFGGFNLNLLCEVVLFGLYTAVGLIILGSKRLKPLAGYLHMFICVGYTMKAAALFMQDTIIVRVSDELLLLLSYVASVLFFLALGRFIAGNESKLTRSKLFIFGGCTFMLTLCASLAGYIALAINPDYLGTHMKMHPLSETGTALIALTVIMTVYSRKTLPVPSKNGESNEEILR